MRGAAKTLLLVALAAMSLSATANATIPVPIDWHYIWYGPGGGWQMIADHYGYGPPRWDTDYQVWIPNIEMPYPWHKTVWWEPVWQGPPPIIQPPDPQVKYPGEPLPRLPDIRTPGVDDWTFGWYLPTQPRYEWIIFGWPSWRFLLDPQGMPLRYMEFGTYCVPEPASLALLGLGGLALIRRRKP